MEWQVKVWYKGAEAHYKVSLDQNKFFQAELIAYNGGLDFDPPPQKLIMFKGIRSWIGSTENTGFLNMLGRHIEYLYTSDDFLTPDRYYPAKRTRGSGPPETRSNRQP